MMHLGVYYLRHNRHKEAFQLFKQASKYDNEAYIPVGFCYAHGLGVEENELEAISLYQKGFRLQDRTEKTSEVADIVLDADSWLFKKAIEKGNEYGRARLGILYQNGSESGLAVDYSEALRLLLMAEKKGSNIASVEIGNIHYFGDGDQVDYISAAAHFRQAHMNGWTQGTVELGHCYYDGIGVEQDRDEAFRLGKVASDAGCAQAHAIVANALCAGIGVQKDLEEAERLFTIGIDMGNSKAQNALGVKYLLGNEFVLGIDEGYRLLRLVWFVARAGL